MIGPFVIFKGNIKEQAAGTWWLWMPHSEGLSSRVCIKCPKCGRIGMLDHDVADDGTVSPSLDCPSEGCAFHEHVKLRGWTT